MVHVCTCDMALRTSDNADLGEMEMQMRRANPDTAFSQESTNACPPKRYGLNSTHNIL